MFKGSVPADERTYSKTYRGFRGVDLTNAITEVDDTRSPYAPNMIASLGGFPKKRTGYGLVDRFPGRINGIHSFVTANGIKKMVVHAGTELYSYEPSAPVVQPSPPASYIYIALMPEHCMPKKIYGGAVNGRSVSFVFGGKLYVLDGGNYICWDGSEASAKNVEDSAYVPTTAISMPPTGGGEDFEPVNLLQPRRINSFLVTEAIKAETVFQLDAENIDAVEKCEKRNSAGSWEQVTGFAVDAANGKVTFASAPGKSPVDGEDNVKITFRKTVAGYAERIKNCTIRTFYGIGNDLRVFVSGNNNYRNYDWCSWSGRADYFPDNGYSVIGAENNAVMGYLKQYDDLVIVKQGNDQDASIFLRSATLGSDNKAVFTTKQGLAGVGAASKYCFGTLYDDNLFLSAEGVFGLDTSSVTLQKTTQLRSHYVNAELTAEAGLGEAVACVRDGYYYLFINGRAYIADSRQRNENPSKSFGYEWYYWTDIPARCVSEYEDQLYFGDADGGLFRFKDEVADGMEAYSDNGAAIFACWSTKMDDLGDCSKVKRIMKTGTGVQVMPFGKSSGKIYYVTDAEKFVREYSMSTAFDFDDIDFDNIDFGTLPYPAFVPCRKTDRKAKMLQMVVENSEVNEGFGIYKIRVEYAPAKPIKR